MKRRHGAVAATALGAGLAAFAALGAATEPGDVRIGHIVPLTGPLAQVGPPRAAAGRLAGELLNRAVEGTGTRFTVLTRDGRGDSRVATDESAGLIDRDEVACIAGPAPSAQVIAAAENTTIDSGVPLIAPSATAPDITRLEDQGLVFRTAPSDLFQAEELVDLVRRAYGRRATVAVGGRNDQYGRGIVAEFARRWRAGGGTVSAEAIWRPGSAASERRAARALVAGRPRAWVVADLPGDWPGMGAALLRTGRWSAARTFAADALRNVDPAVAGRRATEGLRGTVPATTGAPAGAAFDREWAARGLGPRVSFDASNFDAVILCGLAAVKAGSTSPRAVADQIRAVSGPPGTRYTFEQLPQAVADLRAGRDIDYEGASGKVDLDARGDLAVARYSPWSVRGGRVVVSSAFTRLSTR